MKPAKTASVLLLCLAALILILTIGAALFTSLYPKEKVLERAILEAEAALGRSVSVRDFSYSFVGVALDTVSIHESGIDSPVLASAGKARLTLSVPALLRFRLDFDSISLEKARLNVVFDANGKSNIGKLFTALSAADGRGVDATLSRLYLSEALVTISSPPSFLAPLEGNYTLDAEILLDHGIEIRDCDIVLPEGRGTLHPDIHIDTYGTGLRISGGVRLTNVSLEWAYRFGKNIDLPYRFVNGAIKDLVITNTLIKGNVKAFSTLRGSAAVFRAVGFCAVDLPGRTLSIERMACSVGKSSFTIDSFLLSFAGKPVRFGIKAIDGSITELAALLPFIPARLFGLVTGNLKFDGTTYNGSVSISGGGYDPALKIISSLRAVIVIENGIFSRTGIPFNFYGNPCLLSIASTDPSLKRLFVNISADTFRYDPKPGGMSGSDAPLVMPIEISGIIESRHLSIGRHDFNALHLRYRLAGAGVTIPALRFTYAGGNISGNGTIVMGQGPPRASLFLDIAGLRIQNALSHKEEWRDRFFGVMNGRSNIDFEMSGMVLDTARGALEFNIDKGKLVDTGIQKGLGLLLSDMRYKLRDMEFNRIYGNIGIRGTNYLVNSFIFNSPAVRLKISGSFDRKLIANPLDIHLEFTREFIQDLPGLLIAPWLNRYRTNDWYAIPFVVTGDMTEGKNVRRAE